MKGSGGINTLEFSFPLDFPSSVHMEHSTVIANSYDCVRLCKSFIVGGGLHVGVVYVLSGLIAMLVPSTP